MPFANNKSSLRRRIAGLSKRVQNKRFYQDYGRLIIYYYGDLGIWYILKLAMIAVTYLNLQGNAKFSKVHRKRKPELYDLLYHITVSEQEVQAIILQRSIRSFLLRQRLLRKKQEPKAILIQKWWRIILQTKIYPKKLCEMKDVEERSVSTQVSLHHADVGVQTIEEREDSIEETVLRQVLSNAARIRTIQEGLGYIVNLLTRETRNSHRTDRIYDEVTPVALALQEAASLVSPDYMLQEM